MRSPYRSENSIETFLLGIFWKNEYHLLTSLEEQHLLVLAILAILEILGILGILAMVDWENMGTSLLGKSHEVGLVFI